MIAGPWVLVGLPLAVVPIVYLVRRWAFLGAVLAGGTAATLTWLCFAVSPSEPVRLLGWSLWLGQPVTLLGRQLALTPASQMALGLLFGLAAISFMVAWPVSPGRSFFPLGLALLSGWAAALLMRTFAFASVILWLASTLATMVVQGGQLASTRGAGRQMIMLSLAVPLLLLANSLIEARALNPDDFLYTRPAVLLTVAGLAILFAAFPFEGWVSAMAADAQPGVVALVVVGYQVVVLLMALDLFRDQPWLVVDGQILSLLAKGGWLAALIGGGLAAAQRRFSSLLGYTVLNDLGAGLVALALGNRTGLSIALSMIAARAVGLLLAGTGLAVIRFRCPTGGTSFKQVAGLGRGLPLAAVGLLMGGLSLCGFPLMAGFAARWALLEQVTPIGGPWAWGLLLSSLGAMVGWLRGGLALLAPTESPSLPAHRTSLVAGIILLALVISCLWLGRYPYRLLLWLRPLVDAYMPFVTATGSSMLPGCPFLSQG
jgi:formate hydrogenlyase subunit 3/multisubunit Na+/H+ antiporter MnhD subunit